MNTPITDPTPVYIHLGNAMTGATGFAGPFLYVNIVYNHTIQVEEPEASGDIRDVGWFRNGTIWEMENGSHWTDLTISTTIPVEG